MIFSRNHRLGEIFVKKKIKNKEIKENYQMHAICVVYTHFLLKSLSIRFINEEEEEMCTNFLILLRIKNLRTCQKEVRN